MVDHSYCHETPNKTETDTQKPSRNAAYMLGFAVVVDNQIQGRYFQLHRLHLAQISSARLVHGDIRHLETYF